METINISENTKMMYARSSYELGYLQNNDRNTYIDKLNDDCLRHIFMLLPIVDRIRIRKVCKRWKIITEQCWYSIKTLYISSPDICFYSSDIHRFSKPDNVKLEPLFSKCGKYIRNFNLFQSTEDKYNSIFDEIIQFCPNLTSITILNYLPDEVQKCAEAYYYGHDELYKRAKCTFPHKYQHQDEFRVKKFSVDRRCLEVDISVLFRKFPNLESLSLRYCSDVFGKTFFYLPTQTLHTLIFEYCYINDINFSMILKQVTNLKHLEIHKCGYVNKSMEAIKYCTNLRILKINLGNIYRKKLNLREQHMLSFTHLTKLQILKLWHIGDLSNTDIADIVSHCQQLTCIDIEGFCPNVTDIGLETIATLPKLEKLFISLLCSVTDNGLRNIRNLKELKCVCGRITIDGILSIIRSSPQLHLLNISHRNISYESFTLIKELYPRLIVIRDI